MAQLFGPGTVTGIALAQRFDFAQDWPWLLAALGWLVAAIAGIVLLVHIARRRRLRLHKQYTLQIANAGNVRDRYELRVEEASGEFTFRLLCGREPLPVRQVSRTVSLPPAAVQPTLAPASSTVPAATAAASPAAGKPAAVAAAGRASATATQADGALSGITALLDTLGQILPGSLGQSLRRTAYNMNIKQSQVKRVTVEPKRQADRVKRLRGQAKSVAPIGAVRSAPHAAAETGTPPPPDVAAAGPAVQTVVETWSQTPFLEPGANLVLAMVIAPLRRPMQDMPCAFKVLSRSVEQEEATPLVSEQKIQWCQFSWFGLYWPALLLGVLLAVVLAGSLYSLWTIRLQALLGL